MSAETPNPQPGDRVRVTYVGMYEPTPHGPLLVSDGSPKRSIFEDAIIEVLERALCPEIEGATGIRCQQPTGHVGGHKGTTTEEQTKAVGYPLFVSWPAESEPPARRSVRVENTPGVPVDMQQRIGELLVRGDLDDAMQIALRYMPRRVADEYLRDLPEWATYSSRYGRTEVDPAEADRMRAMGFNKQPEVKISEEDRLRIEGVLVERMGEYLRAEGQGDQVDTSQLAGVVADIVWAAIRRDRERGDR